MSDNHTGPQNEDGESNFKEHITTIKIRNEKKSNVKISHFHHR